MSEEKIMISVDAMRRLARYEISFRDLVPDGDVAGAEFVCAGRYETTLEDFRDLFKRLKEVDPTTEEFRRDWFAPFIRLADEFGLNRPFDSDEEENLPIRRSSGLEILEGARFHEILFFLSCACDDDVDDDRRLTETFNCDAWSGRLDLFLANQGKPYVEWEFDRSEKEGFLRHCEDEEFLASASETELTLARRFVEELCEKDSVDALHFKAHSLFAGNRLFPKDLRASRRYLTRVFEKTDDPDAAVSLGDLYYYGLGADGVPDYDAAFRYYSFAAVNDEDEGLYKLGDLYRHGHGCRKSGQTAFKLYEKAYDKTRNSFLRGGYYVDFVDAALRMGIACSEGLGGDVELEKAFGFFLEAEYATKYCGKRPDFIGVSASADEVEKKLTELRERLPDGFIQEDYVDFDWPYLFHELTREWFRCELARYDGADGRIALVAKRTPEDPDLALITVPELAFCERTRAALFTVDGSAEVWFKDDANRVRFDRCDVDDSSSRYEFYDDDELVASVGKTRFRFHGAKREAYGPEYRLATVEEHPNLPKRRYFCDDDVQTGDRVFVDHWYANAEDKEVEVNVVETTVLRESELPNPPEYYHRVLRKAR